ncbi:MAG: fliQ [Alphaproteobacteria bacterium]|nr:fliQ [Alphaproteobacteria bacterium]
MNGVETLDLARDTIWLAIKVSAPVMLVGLVVGLVVSLLQALTQIQEQTLAYVPKIIAIFVALYLFMPYMSANLNEFMIDLADRIVKVE